MKEFQQSLRIFISYSHDSPRHSDRVLALSDRLCAEGIDAILDQYEPHPPEGWPRWMMDQVEQAAMVLIICTETYNQRFRGKSVKGAGKGGNWEGAIITQELYDANAYNEKFIPVILDPEQAQHIPLPLKWSTYYDLSQEAGYENLYRRITNQPHTVKPQVGKMHVLNRRELDMGVVNVAENVSHNYESNLRHDSVTPSSQTRLSPYINSSTVETNLLMACVQVVLAVCILAAAIVISQLFLVSVLNMIPAVSTWPLFTKYAIVGVFLGFGGLLLNMNRIRRTVREGENIQQRALDELKRRIRSRLDTQELLSPNSIRSLAYGIGLQLKCPVITDNLIIEAIRSLALDLEDEIKGALLTQRLKALNEIIRSIDAEQPPLLSIAAVDRLTAYRLSQPFLFRLFFYTALLICAAQFFTGLSSLYVFSFSSNMLYVISTALTTFELLLILSTVRAEFFWKKHREPSNRRPWYVRWLSPKRLNPVLDFFLRAIVSQERWAYNFWHLKWAPLWESKYFISPRALTEGVDSKFLKMHEFRLDVARRLACDLRTLQRELDLAAMNNTPADPHFREQFQLLCRRLWVITGDAHFREMERRCEITKADEQHSVMRLL